jgi:hypothetical protein
MREGLTKELEKQDWKRIIKELVPYAHLRLKLWGLLGKGGLKGYQPQDIAFKAIEMVLNDEWKWDPQKADLLPYLKYHVVKGLVANLARNSEVVNSSDNRILTYQEPAEEFSIEDELNASIVIHEIYESVKDDLVVTRIVEGLSNGLKRSDICELHQMDSDAYDNGVRRLRTKLMQLEKKDLFTITHGRGKNK